jgi:hypothetical protein
MGVLVTCTKFVLIIPIPDRFYVNGNRARRPSVNGTFFPAILVLFLQRSTNTHPFLSTGKDRSFYM